MVASPDSIPSDPLQGLRDRALIAVTLFPFARMSAVLGMRRSGCYEKRPPAPGSGLLRRAASAPKSPFITKSSIRVTARFLAVAVGEGGWRRGADAPPFQAN